MRNEKITKKQEKKKKKSRRHNLRLRHPQIPALMPHTHNHDLVHRQRAGPDAQMRHRALARELLAEEEEARVAREDLLGELCARDRFPGRGKERDGNLVLDAVAVPLCV